MHKPLLKLAIPNILSNITIPLTASVDTALIGHLSAKHLGAIALGSMIFTFVYGSFNFLRMGTTGMMAQSYGAGDQKQVSLTLYRALILSLMIALFLVIFQKPILSLAITLLNGEAYSVMIEEYFNTRIWAVFGAFLNFSLMGFYFGVSNSMIPLYMTVVANLSNITLSYIFVYKLNMNISGVALGTLISQYLGLVVGLYFLKDYFLKKTTFEEIVQKDKLLRFFHINKDIFIRTLILTATLALTYSLGSKHSVEALALITVFMQFMIWMAYGVDGFAGAVESLVGRYYGEKNRDKLFQVIKLGMIYGFLLSLGFSLVYLIWTREIVELFVTDSKVVPHLLSYKLFFVITPLLSFIAFIFDGVMIGLTQSKVLRDSVIWGTFSFLGVFFAFKSFNYEFWLLSGFLLFFIVRGLYQGVIFVKKSDSLW